MRKIIIITSGIITVAIFLTAGILYALNFGGIRYVPWLELNRTIYGPYTPYKTWNSYEEAQEFFGDKFFYFSLPEFIATVDDTVRSSEIKNADRENLTRDSFYNLDISTVSIDDENVFMRIFYGVVDLPLWETLREGLNRYDKTTYGTDDDDRWEESHRHIEIVNCIEVTFDVDEFKSRAYFTLGDHRYYMEIGMSSYNTKPPLSLSTEELKPYHELIKQWLDRMAYSIIEQL